MIYGFKKLLHDKKELDKMSEVKRIDLAKEELKYGKAFVYDPHKEEQEILNRAKNGYLVYERTPSPRKVYTVIYSSYDEDSRLYTYPRMFNTYGDAFNAMERMKVSEIEDEGTYFGAMKNDLGIDKFTNRYVKTDTENVFELSDKDSDRYVKIELNEFTLN